ncbi:hypothetical protein, partial [Microvirga sp. CF3016]|uniref:hypothetical protein n=1 Tax=Microvirga sp. CF3016 TaxID=3110181 RepID=UPI002E765E7E
MAELKITAGPQGTNVDDYEVEFVENVPLGIVIGTISGDPAATQYSFYIDDDGVKWDGEGRVTIVGDKIYLSTTGPGLNYEMASGAYQIWIVAKNAAGDEVNQAVFGLSLADANDAPTDLTVKNATGGTTFSFQENTTPTGTFVAVLTSKDEDRTAQGGAGDTFTYSLVDDLGGRFKVATATVAGKTQYQIQAGSNGTLIDFEDYGAGKLLKSDDNGNSRYYELKVRVTDGGGPDGASAAKYTEQTIKVYVTNDTADDQNLPPNAPTGGSGTLKENTASTNTLVQLAGSTDPEGLAVTYDFAANGNPNSLFALSADGKLTLATGKTLDYEAAGLSSDGTGKYYLVKVVAKDPAGNASTATDVKVYVTNDTADDQNLPPNAPTGGSGTLKENTAST